MTTRLDDVLAGRTPSGVYRYYGRAAPETIERQCTAAGWRFFYLDGREIVTKESFIAAVGAAASFPDYSASNWDALEESLRDLSWAPAEGYVLLWDDPRFLVASDPEAFRTALSVLRSVTRAWEDKGTPMVVLLRRSGRGVTI